jgi:trypsin
VVAESLRPKLKTLTFQLAFSRASIKYTFQLLKSTMKFSYVLAVAATGLATAQAAITPLIVGGTEVPIGEKTWMVGLRDDINLISRCGGMLITPTKVLSAGHCPTFGYAAVGTHYKINGTDGEQIKIVSEVKHPKYNEPDDNAADWDYKIITLAKPSKFKPVQVLIDNPTRKPLVGKFATAIGWGNTREEQNGTHDSASRKLLRVDLKLRTMKECADLGMKPLDESMVCAGGVEGEDTCNGDSGGPLFMETSRGDAVIGIVSWGNGCARKDQPGVYARISTVVGWIKQNAPGAKFISYPDF